MIITYWIIALFMAFSGVSGTVGATTLTVAQLAAHYHDQGTQVEDWTGNPSWAKRGDKQDSRTGWAAEFRSATGYVGSVSDTGSSTSHAHSFSGIKSGSASSLPPYYALAYIMRIA